MPGLTMQLTGKSRTPGERASAPGGALAEPGSFFVLWRWSGCRSEGDGESERFQLADVVACLLGFVGAAGVVAGAEFAEADDAAGQQVPDDDQDGPGDGDQGLELAAAADDPPVAFAEEGVGAGGAGGGLAEQAPEVGVALAGLAMAGLGPGLDGARGQLGPRHQV